MPSVVIYLLPAYTEVYTISQHMEAMIPSLSCLIVDINANSVIWVLKVPT